LRFSVSLKNLGSFFRKCLQKHQAKLKIRVNPWLIQKMSGSEALNNPIFLVKSIFAKKPQKFP
jgi:hypothetical protein